MTGATSGAVRLLRHLRSGWRGCSVNLAYLSAARGLATFRTGPDLSAGRRDAILGVSRRVERLHELIKELAAGT